ncbi:hypothetical protein Prudu_1449S000200 [Prunus dulcis]|uniref:Hemerythrin-like domain-containing protein n=1 Tax=Prunus dulcis TaxID=3755 RepID=A0A5H2XQW5_PRUDU|nr:hypothetical protein Prudu_1449S000200 [Prunus dulcis]
MNKARKKEKGKKQTNAIFVSRCERSIFDNPTRRATVAVLVIIFNYGNLFREAEEIDGRDSAAKPADNNHPIVRLPKKHRLHRVALKYKAAAVSLRCVVDDTCGGDDHNANENLVVAVEVAGSSSPQTERVSGPPSTLLQFIDTRFPHPPLLLQIRSAETTSLVAAVVKLTELQHRSVTWHLERLVRWATDLLTRQNKRGGRGGEIDPTVGTARMEVRKLGRSYTQLLELMLEHAQMEERLLFPLFNFADPMIYKAANEEHARDLPIMNGIKEDIKSIEVIDNGSPAYQEALSNFSKRLKSLQERYRQHFLEEERELLPYMEAAELNKEQQQRLLDQCVDRLVTAFLMSLGTTHKVDNLWSCEVGPVRGLEQYPWPWGSEMELWSKRGCAAVGSTLRHCGGIGPSRIASSLRSYFSSACFQP